MHGPLPPGPGALSLWGGIKYARCPSLAWHRPATYTICDNTQSHQRTTVLPCCLYDVELHMPVPCPTLAKLRHYASSHAPPELPRMPNAHIWESAIWSQLHAHRRYHCRHHMHESHISPCVVGSCVRHSDILQSSNSNQHYPIPTLTELCHWSSMTEAMHGPHKITRTSQGLGESSRTMKIPLKHGNATQRQQTTNCPT